MLMRPYAARSRQWRERERLRQEMKRLFHDWPTQARWVDAPAFPAMNVWTNEGSAVVTAELPGVRTEDIEVSVENDTLTLRGSREPDELAEGATYHRRERRCGLFTRSFRLPFHVDAEKVDATLQNGVLNLYLPRAEADLPRKIAIKAG
jgi:HSP20 family protein